MKNNIKALISICVLILSSVLLSGCTPSQEEIDKYNLLISEANVFVQAHEYSSAVEKYNEAAELIPTKYEAYDGVVSMLISKNKISDAKSVIDNSATKLETSLRSNLYVLVGNAYYDKQEYDNALNSYELANGILNTNENANIGLAKVYIQKGDVQKAKDILSKGYSDDLKVETNLILSYIESVSDVNKAKDVLDDIKPNDELKDRYQIFKTVLDSLTEDELFNSTKLSKVYLDNNLPYLAILKLEPLKTEMVEYPDGIYFLGKAYYENKKYQESVDTLINISGSTDINQYAYWTMARAYYKMNNASSSFDYYDRAITFAGSDVSSTLYKEYLDILIKENQTTKSIEVVRNAGKSFTELWVNFYSANIYFRDNQLEKVKYYIDKIDETKVEGEYKYDYLYWKTIIAMESNLLDEAKRNLDKYVALDKYDPRYYLLLGKLNIKEGKLDDARNSLNKAIEYDLDGIVLEDATKLLAQIN